MADFEHLIGSVADEARQICGDASSSKEQMSNNADSNATRAEKRAKRLQSIPYAIVEDRVDLTELTTPT